jgi:catechol 2,3-dioxygenase-like lactoylglutathione lyase family enzyme
MNIEPRITYVTLGVADMLRSIRFYRDGLGWPTDAKDGADHAIFRTSGTRLTLYSRHKLALDISPDMRDAGSGFGGITLGHNVRTKRDVSAALGAAERAGGRILKPAKEAEWGGVSGYFADPDGYPWEVAWPGDDFYLSEDGTLWGGPLGDPAAP